MQKQQEKPRWKAQANTTAHFLGVPADVWGMGLITSEGTLALKASYVTKAVSPEEQVCVKWA